MTSKYKFNNEDDLLQYLKEQFPEKTIVRDRLPGALYRQIREFSQTVGMSPLQYLSTNGFIVYINRLSPKAVLQKLAELAPDKVIHSREQIESVYSRLYYMANKQDMRLEDYLMDLGYTLGEDFHIRRPRMITSGKADDDFFRKQLSAYADEHNRLCNIVDIEHRLYESIRKHAQKLGIKPRTYIRRLGFSFTTSRGKIEWTEDRIQMIAEMHRRGMPYRAIGEKFGVSGQRIQQMLKSKGYE